MKNLLAALSSLNSRVPQGTGHAPDAAKGASAVGQGTNPSTSSMDTATPGDNDHAKGMHHLQQAMKQRRGSQRVHLKLAIHHFGKSGKSMGTSGPLEPSI